MLGNFQRRDNRKLRLSNWFACERDGDMQAFDLGGVASGIGVYFDAVLKDRTRQRTARAAGVA